MRSPYRSVSAIKVTAETLHSIDQNGPKPRGQFRGCKDTILGLDFNPVLPQLGASTGNGLVTLWHYDEDGRALSFEGHDGGVNDIQFCDSGDLMLTGGDDKYVRLWVPKTSGEFRSFKGHTAAIRSVCFNPQIPGMIVSASNDKTIKLWSIDWKSKFPEGSKPCRDIDKKKLAKEMEKRRRSVGHVETFLKCFPKLHRNWVRSVRFSKDGSLLISASDDHSVALLDVRNYELVARIPFHLGSPTFATFDPCAGHYIGSSTSNRGFVVHDLRNRQPVQIFENIHKGRVHSFAFHPSGDYAVTVGDDSVAKILDLVEGRPIYTLQGATKDLLAVAFSKDDGDLMAIGGKDKEIVLWKSLLEPFRDEDEDGEEEAGTESNGGGGSRKFSPTNVSPSSSRTPFVWKEPVEGFSTKFSQSSSLHFIPELPE